RVDPVADSQPCGGWGRWWGIALVVVAGLALTGIWAAAGGRPAAPATSGASAARTGGSDGLSRLSVQAQSSVSSAIGAGQKGFAPRRRAGGFGLAGGRVAAALGREGISVRGDGARLSLGLAAVGRAGHLRHLPAVAPRVRAHQVVYARGGGVLE